MQQLFIHKQLAPQVALRWIVQTNVTVCTQTDNKAYFVEDIGLFDWSLSVAQMKAVSAGPSE